MSFDYEDTLCLFVSSHTSREGRLTDPYSRLQKVQPCSWNPKVPALLATGGGDSTCRMWDVPAVGKREKNKEGPILKDNIVCKHSSAQRRADVAAVAWDVSRCYIGVEDGTDV